MAVGITASGVIFGEDCNHGEQFAGPNDEERGQASVPIRASPPRSSSSVSFALGEYVMHARISIGFFVGWTTCFGVLIANAHYELDELEVFVLPVLAALFSMIFVGLSYVAGLPLRKRAFQKIWSRYRYASLLLSVIGAWILYSRLSLMGVVAAAIAYFLVIFPVVNWPIPPDAKNAEPGAPGNAG